MDGSGGSSFPLTPTLSLAQGFLCTNVIQEIHDAGLWNPQAQVASDSISALRQPCNLMGDSAAVNERRSCTQAAAIQEAVEVGSKCLLMDEDLCATNFMVRDARMQARAGRAQL